jgi:transposase
VARRRMDVADIKEILVSWSGGEHVSGIARRLGYSRPTVRKYVAAAQGAGLARHGPRCSEAEWERLTRAAQAAVTPERSPGTAMVAVACHHEELDRLVGKVKLAVIYQRLRDERGLVASWASLYRYVAAHWPERLQAAPRVTIRLDDPAPGEEAQVDFFYVGMWQNPETDRRQRLSAFLMTLSHSRHQFLYPVLAEDGAAWLDGHVAAFRFFGGAPKRLVPDNLTAGILKADRYDPRLNRAYGELTRYYGCLVDPARVGRPQDKPRVERTVSYARESFFKERSFRSLAAMREAAERWAREVAGQRLHGTTGEQPLVAFQEREARALQALPPRPWEPVTWTTASVQPDCHLRAGGVDYSAPFAYVGRRLDVRLGRQLVELYDGAQCVTAHTRAAQGRVTRVEHYPAAGQAFLQGTPKACLEQAEALGKAAGSVVSMLLTPYSLTHLREVQALVRLEEQYPAERIDRACAKALDAGDGRYRTIRRMLEHDLDQLDEEGTTATSASSSGAYLRGPAALVAALPATVAIPAAAPVEQAPLASLEVAGW